MIKKDWFKYCCDGSFFGPFYMTGDASSEGYLIEQKISLEERTDREVNGLIRLMQIDNKSKILDVPCGYGRHIKKLSSMGYVVDGLDINEYYVDIINEKSFVSSKVICGEMNDMPFDDNVYDAVINMFLSFGFYYDEVENISAMREMYRVLKKGGKLLIHSDVNVEQIHSGDYKYEEERRLPDAGKLIINEKYNEIKKRLNGVWSILNADGIGNAYEYSMRVYSVDEYMMMGRCVGFNNIEVYGSFDVTKEAFSSLSQEVILIFQK